MSFSRSMQTPLILKVFNVVFLILQSFFLVLIIERWYIGLIYVIIVASFAILGEIGLSKKNIKLLYTYGIYLTIYLCWASGMAMGMTLFMIWDFTDTDDSNNVQTTTSTNKTVTTTVSTSSTGPTTPTTIFVTTEVQDTLKQLDLMIYIMGMILDCITIIMSIFMLKILYHMLKMLKRERNRSQPIVSYVTRIPGAPPLYTPTSPHTVSNTPISTPVTLPPPVFFEEEPLPSKEDLSQDRRQSLPPSYSQDDPAPPSLVEGETPIL